MLGVIGDVVQDIVVWLQEDIRPATDTKSEITIARGGSAANVAAFAGPRYPTRFIGCVGEDLGGHVVTRELEARGVDVCVQTVDSPTGMIVVLIDHNGERMMFPSRAASGMISTVADSWISDLEILHVTGYSLESEPARSSVLDACRRIHENDGKVSFDVSSTGMIDLFGTEAFKDLVREIKPDIITANSDETAYLDLLDGEHAGSFLQELGNTTLLARAGQNPTRIFENGELIHEVPVIPADYVRDLTGAGDSFNAGFLVSMLKGSDKKQACEDAHALARTVLGFPGASDGTELKEVL